MGYVGWCICCSDDKPPFGFLSCSWGLCKVVGGLLRLGFWVLEDCFGWFQICFMQKRLGDGVDTCFWKDTWNGELPFKLTYPRLYALEVDKNISVVDKLAQATLAGTFRREPESGIEAVQLAKLEDQLEDVQLVNKRDRWAWSLNGSGEFSVASIRRLLDDIRLPEVSSQTRWIKAVPIKGGGIGEPCFFSCYVAKDNFKKVCRWWNVDFAEVSSYDEWLLWISSLRIHGSSFYGEAV
uniref:RNA-directed DNA polymerase, eukaryota, reverse transcriptase zinc-binding domain protein n=1 Tax=Tanacetum cinerariifolium TaxID=118510 RepID=A0A6L2LXD1_TANCI|nr:RNA-directed DNA polymerase, eukaryota, reverse transcriptase zinc-binding domain protein [Tanacetum cinerariifolium]